MIYGHYCLLAITTPNLVVQPVPLDLPAASPFSTSYVCEYFKWVPCIAESVTIAFQFQNNPDGWFMDDVSMSNGADEIL
jgi:hypothetical protein